jgi:hypothetical protein
VYKYNIHASAIANLGICWCQGIMENFIEESSLMVDQIKYIESVNKEIIVFELCI